MEIQYIILFILWICFWSFSTVLIERWKKHQWWILTGRSECPHCKKTLSFIELFPIFSWIIQWGRCRGCKTKIPLFYPFSELLMGSIFVCMWYVSNSFGYTFEDIFFWIFLFWGFTTWVYILYDIRYTEIPDQMMIPAILINLIVLCLWLPYHTLTLEFFDSFTYPQSTIGIQDHLIGAILIYSFFYLQIFIPWIMFLIRKKLYRKIWELIFLFFAFPYIWIRELMDREVISHDKTTEEIPTWIGAGDLRIALFIGLTLWTIHSISSVMFAYIIGSVVWIGIIVFDRYKWRKNISHQIAFGPFLWIGWIVSLIFHSEIIWYIYK